MKYKAEIGADGVIVLEAIDTPQAEQETAQAPTNEPAWRPITELPQDDSLAIVLTKDGCKYFASPRNGRWDKKVAYWLPLPKEPK